MNFEELKKFTFELIEKIENSGIECVSVEFEQTKISVVNSGRLLTSSVATENAYSSSAADTAPAAFTAANKNTVNAPMVGTFYRAPAPDAKPFVEVGDKICKGETICIIEAMKLMNEIESDKSGVVKEILVQNGDVVEFGQPLIVVE
ncbi:MAG: Biotin carboxyl carrier protein of acetyl-CoA carboxylase [Firmicutes bacterium ADurb.Bin193]|nr:MAG: Biotin carboxyl carrier protein of acetyl-CoA carboxylase [Firmicutes bacterium ADurb.Bin193]